jgi:uncharacterized protein
MKLHDNLQPNQQRVTRYGANFIEINHVRYESSVILTATEVIPTNIVHFDSLTEADFTALLSYKPEIVLLGTGSKLRFPHPSLTQALTTAQIGVDAMDTGAACRTFNILTDENRRVVALILLNC